mgnify:CR=1 FL=1
MSTDFPLSDDVFGKRQLPIGSTIGQLEVEKLLYLQLSETLANCLKSKAPPVKIEGDTRKTEAPPTANVSSLWTASQSTPLKLTTTTPNHNLSTRTRQTTKKPTTESNEIEVSSTLPTNNKATTTSSWISQNMTSNTTLMQNLNETNAEWGMNQTNSSDIWWGPNETTTATLWIPGNIDRSQAWLNPHHQMAPKSTTIGNKKPTTRSRPGINSQDGKSTSKHDETTASYQTSIGSIASSISPEPKTTTAMETTVQTTSRKPTPKPTPKPKPKPKRKVCGGRNSRYNSYCRTNCAHRPPHCPRNLCVCRWV